MLYSRKVALRSALYVIVHVIFQRVSPAQYPRSQYAVYMLYAVCMLYQFFPFQGGSPAQCPRPGGRCLVYRVYVVHPAGGDPALRHSGGEEHTGPSHLGGVQPPRPPDSRGQTPHSESAPEKPKGPATPRP